MDEFERRSRRELNKARKASALRNKAIADKHVSQAQFNLKNWARLNPDLATYDNDGNPIDSEPAPHKYPVKPEYMH